jgi:hypothetical protein
MFCSKCGSIVGEQQAFCARCGYSMASASTARSDLVRFEGKIRRLSRYFYLFAAINVVLGVMGLFAVQTGWSMRAGPWEPWPHPYIWDWTLGGGVGWTLLMLRAGFAVAAGWGLARRTDWSRPVTLTAACLAFLEFPIGLVLAIYTAVILLGRQHRKLFAELGESQQMLAAK